MQKKAFTLVELFIVVLFLGIFAYIAVIRVNSNLLTSYSRETLSQKIITDLRLARQMAISQAATNSSGFALNMIGTTPYSGYQIVNLSNNEIISSHIIDSKIVCTGGASFRFGVLGSLLNGSDTQLVIASAGKSCTIAITAATGTVKIIEN